MTRLVVAINSGLLLYSAVRLALTAHGRYPRWDTSVLAVVVAALVFAYGVSKDEPGIWALAWVSAAINMLLVVWCTLTQKPDEYPARHRPVK